MRDNTPTTPRCCCCTCPHAPYSDAELDQAYWDATQWKSVARQEALADQPIIPFLELLSMHRTENKYLVLDILCKCLDNEGRLSKNILDARERNHRYPIRFSDGTEYYTDIYGYRLSVLGHSVVERTKELKEYQYALAREQKRGWFR